MDKKTIIAPTKWDELAKSLIKTARFYAGFCLLALLITLPTKGVWLLITWLWNVF